MLVVELEKDELADSGAFVKIGCVAGAIARANGSNNLLDAERKIFPRINAGVQKNILNPIDPETHEPLSRSDYGIGIVPFAELVKWGHATKLYNFKRPRNEKVKNMLLKCAEEERIRETNQPERMRLLASKKHLGLGDWIEITGFGIGDEDHYTTTEKSIRFIGWPDDLISSFPPHEQADMVRQNAEPGLDFPCTPKELLDFVDSGAGRFFGSFIIPDEFRTTVDALATAKAEIAKAKAAGVAPRSLSDFPGAGFPAPYGPDDKMYYGAKKLPDWDYWQHMPEVEYWQACALALDIDPDSLERHPQGWMVPGSDLFTPESLRGQADRFDKLLRLLRAHLGNGQFFTPTHSRTVLLREFAAWCAHVGNGDIPKELAALAENAPQTAPIAVDQAAPDKPKLKGGRPKTIDKKANAVRQIIEHFEKTAGIKFVPQDLPGSAADLLDACQRMEKIKTGKREVFCASTAAFNTWLKTAAYGFSDGRTPDAEQKYWTQLCVKTTEIITPEVFTEVYDKATP